MVIQFVVAVAVAEDDDAETGAAPTLAEQLRTVADGWRAHEEMWLAQRRSAIPFASGPERREAERQLRIEHRRRRETGELRGSRLGLITHHVRAILAARQWLDRTYDPVPDGGIYAGRPWGIGSGREGRLDGRVKIELADDLGEQLRRACYWESLPAVTELQEWYDRHGDGPGAAEREGGTLGALLVLKHAMGGPSAADMEQRDQLRNQITTTGDILRAAIDTAARDIAPPLPDN